MTVRAQIVSIGNSQGVRIPKLLLEQSGIEGEVELEVNEGKIVIHAVKPARNNWDQAFEEMAAQGDDSLLDEYVINTSWEEEEWQW